MTLSGRETEGGELHELHTEMALWVKQEGWKGTRGTGRTRALCSAAAEPTVCLGRQQLRIQPEQVKEGRLVPGLAYSSLSTLYRGGRRSLHIQNSLGASICLTRPLRLGLLPVLPSETPLQPHSSCCHPANAGPALIALSGFSAPFPAAAGPRVPVAVLLLCCLLAPSAGLRRCPWQAGRSSTCSSAETRGPLHAHMHGMGCAIL